MLKFQFDRRITRLIPQKGNIFYKALIVISALVSKQLALLEVSFTTENVRVDCTLALRTKLFWMRNVISISSHENGLRHQHIRHIPLFCIQWTNGRPESSCANLSEQVMLEKSSFPKKYIFF